MKQSEFPGENNASSADGGTSVRSRSRRAFLKTSGAVAAAVVVCRKFPLSLAAATNSSNAPAPTESYETHAKGIRILPGQWRPHYPWEHIAWVSPSWPSQDYLWLDFPEAVFSNQGLLYLSHVNPPIQTVFSDLPAVPWRPVPAGIAFDRTLPNGVAFGGSVTRANANTVALELHLENGSAQPLTNITLQTCVFLRGIKEFADYTRANKFVHLAERGWVSVQDTSALPENSGPYRVGWRRSGKRLADWPVLATVSNQGGRLVAMTWQQDTLSLVSNPNHPCMHADPQFKDLTPGQRASIRGKLLFFEGRLEDLNYARHLAD